MFDLISVLAILGFAVLFGVFGLLAPGEEATGCGGGCALKDGGDACGSCPHEGDGWDWKPDGVPTDRPTVEIEP